MALQLPDDLLFGIPEIDKQHEDLFNMYNDFSDAVIARSSDESVFNLFERIEGYSSSHRYEERLIIKSGYPNAEIHMQEHVQIFEAINHFKMMINTEGTSREILLSIKRHLIRTLINHVKNCDLRLCKHLHGFKKDSRPVSESESAVHNAGRLGGILVAANLISPSTLELALNRQKESSEKIGVVLVGMGAVTTEDVIEANAIQLGLLRKKMQD